MGRSSGGSRFGYDGRPDLFGLAAVALESGHGAGVVHYITVNPAVAEQAASQESGARSVTGITDLRFAAVMIVGLRDAMASRRQNYQN